MKNITVLVSGGGTNLQALIDAERGGASGEAQHKRPVFLVVVDGSDDVVGRPFAHVVIIFLNNDLHCNYLVSLTMNVPTVLPSLKIPLSLT